MLLPLVALVALGFVEAATGFQCYECSWGKGQEDRIGYHKNCKEGKLPNSLVVTCSIRGLVLGQNGKPMNSTEVESRLRQGERYACIKEHEKHRGEELIFKACTFAESRGDHCEEYAGTDSDYKDCICHQEKCNGVGYLTPTVLFLTLLIMVSHVFVM